jgi:hypothetical protein
MECSSGQLRKRESWKMNLLALVFKNISRSLNDNSTARFTVAGFRSTGICSFSPDFLPETSFAPKLPLRTSVTLQRQQTQDQEVTSGNSLQLSRSFCPRENTYSKNWSKAITSWRSLNMNSTLVTRDLFRVIQGKEQI